MQGPTIQAAALNNAVWCDAVCAAGGSVTEFNDGLWRSHRPGPPYFPSVVSLSPAMGLAAVERALPQSGGVSVQVAVKDSFSDLDLSPIGFTKLFDACWIWREPGPAETRATQLTWRRIVSHGSLRAWEAGWWPEGPVDADHQWIFRPAALLGRSDIAFLSGHVGDELVAGAAVTQTGAFIGLTCSFFPPTQRVSLHQELLTVLDAWYPSRPVLGYESGDDLAESKALGFRELGPLRVWLGPAK